jgi:hypothetical protein
MAILAEWRCSCLYVALASTFVSTHRADFLSIKSDNPLCHDICGLWCRSSNRLDSLWALFCQIEV